MIHDWQVFDDCHQSCKRCGLRLWRARSGGSWNAVTGDGVPASFGLLPDGSRIECRRPRNLLPAIVVIDYTGDPDRHSGCERFMHRVRDGADPAPALELPSAAPTACGYPAVFWELGPARLHLGWTWCLECFPDRAGDNARSRTRLPEHAERWLAAEAVREAKREADRKLAERKATRRAELLDKARKAMPQPPEALRYCYCSKCAGGWPSQVETVRAIKSVVRKPQGWNPR